MFWFWLNRNFSTIARWFFVLAYVEIWLFFISALSR